MAFRVLQGFCLGAGVDVHPGDEIELRESEAHLYLQQGRVARIPAPAPAPGPTPPAAAEQPSDASLPPPGSPPAATHHDPIATTRGRGRGRG